MPSIYTSDELIYDVIARCSLHLIVIEIYQAGMEKKACPEAVLPSYMVVLPCHIKGKGKKQNSTENENLTEVILESIAERHSKITKPFKLSITLKVYGPGFTTPNMGSKLPHLGEI